MGIVYEKMMVNGVWSISAVRSLKHASRQSREIIDFELGLG